MKTTALLLFFGVVFAARLESQDRIALTPTYIQDGFGPGGFDLPDDGTVQCFTTSWSMNLNYLANVGFTQIMPQNATFDDHLNMVRILSGLSGTNNFSGTTSTGVQRGLEVFLAARGIDESLIHFESSPNPTVDWFTDQLAEPNRVAFLSVGWFSKDAHGNSWSSPGGHGLAVVGTIPSPGGGGGDIIVNNPTPSTLLTVADIPVNGTQTLETTAFFGTSPQLPDPPYIQFDWHQPGSTLTSTSTAVISSGMSMRLDESAKPIHGWTPTTWTLEAHTREIDTYDGGTLEVLAPVAGSYGFHKTGFGMLDLTSTNSTSGTNQIENGVIRSNAASGTPLGTGSIEFGSGELMLTPKDSADAIVSLTLASGPGGRLSVSKQAIIHLKAGNHDSLVVTAGDPTRAVGDNLTLDDHAVFLLAPDHGWSGLGTVERFVIAGAGSLPTTNGILMPGIVAVNNDLAQSGTFVRVDENNEFLTAHYSAPQPIVDAGPADVYDATTTQFVGPGVSAEVYALRVHSTTITGDIGSSLKVGPDTSGERAGVILNNGSLSVGTLDFGASEGFIYTSRHTSGVPTNAGGVIESTITGTGGLTTYGAGTLVLNAANTYTGPTHIRHGTLLAKSANSSTGSGDVFVSAGGTLAVEGSVAGHVQVDDGLLSLRGGVMEGDVSISEDGALEGNGTIIGDLVVSGEVFAGETAGILSLQGDVNFNGYSVWYWRLDSLTDDHTGTAGVDWNMIQFEAAAHNTIHMGDPGGVQFSLAGDFSNFAPDGNVFWTEHHQWTIMTSTTDLFTNGNTFDVYFGFKNFEQGSFFWDDVDGGTKIKLYYAPNVIPEPTTALLVVLGIVGFLVIKRARLVK